MTSATFFGKAFVQRAALLLITVALGGCFEEKSDDPQHGRDRSGRGARAEHE